MPKRRQSLCVIGGGFTGIAAAIGCLERVTEPFRLHVIEPDASLGRGVAFGRSCTRLECSSSTCSSRGAGLRLRICFSAIS